MLFNLQFFANPNTNTTTSQTLSAEMKTYYEKQLIEDTMPNLVHEQFGQKKPIPEGTGKSIEFRKYADLPKALAPLTEGVTPDGSSLSVSTVTATVAQYGDYIVLSDLLDMTAIDDNIVQSLKLLGRQCGKTRDTIVREILNGGTSVLYASKWSGTTETEVTNRKDMDDSCVLKADTVHRASTQLAANDAPQINGAYVAIIHPYVTYDIRNDSEWIDVHKYSETTEIFNREIGMLHGVRFVESTEAKIFYGADLSATSRALTVNGAVSAATTINVDETLVANALNGRYVWVGTAKVKVTGNTTSAITVDTAVTCADDSKVYPGEGAPNGKAIFSTLFLGGDAYGVTSIAGRGAETIVKQLGSSGVGDALNQRSSVGWKCDLTAEILQQPYMLRVESISSRYSGKVTKAN